MSTPTDLKSDNMSAHLEEVPTQTDGENRVIGSVRLIDQGEIVLVPTPTADPRDPLNLPTWRKIAIIINVSIFAASATLMASSFGAILPIVSQEYHGNPKVSDLVTFPALFIGIGNAIFVPISHGIGRRPIYLFSLVLLIASCIWAALCKSLNSHIAARDIMSLAAGQAEALCPIMVQEIYFLHQRGNRIAWFCALQTLGTAALTIASSYLASSIGWRWWYGVFAIVNACCLIMAIFTVTETRYPRSPEALVGKGNDSNDKTTNEAPIFKRVTTAHRPPIDTVNYTPCSFWEDLAVFHCKPVWHEAVRTWKAMLTVFLFPNILWLVLTMGSFLSIFVCFGGTFAGTLVAPPYDWSYGSIGFVFAGQIIVSLVVVPVQGYLSDYLITYMSKKNNGISEPEHRLITLIPPFIAAIVSTVIFGQASQYPDKWHWSAIAVSFNVEFYGFVGSVVAAFTYAIDAYPNQSDAILVLFCFLRGLISWGISYGALGGIPQRGYAFTYDTCAIILGVIGFLGVFVYVFGKQIRRLTQKWAGLPI